jgi:hypothetical protein
MFTTVIPAEAEILAIMILLIGSLNGLAFGTWRNVKNRNRTPICGSATESLPVSARIALKGRSKIILVSRVAGAISLLGAFVCAILTGLGLDPSIAEILLAVSIMVFSCVELDRWRPGWGGIVLCGLTFISVFVISCFAIDDTYGFKVFDAAFFSFLIGAPMFAIGTLLFLSAERQLSGLDYVWWIEFVLAVAVAGYFLFHTGGSIERIVHDELLKWLGLNI